MAETENHSNDIESGAPFMKCEGFAQITDLMDYLDNSALKPIMAKLVRKLYELAVVDAPALPTRATM